MQYSTVRDMVRWVLEQQYDVARVNQEVEVFTVLARRLLLSTKQNPYFERCDLLLLVKMEAELDRLRVLLSQVEGRPRHGRQVAPLDHSRGIADT